MHAYEIHMQANAGRVFQRPCISSAFGHSWRVSLRWQVLLGVTFRGSCFHNTTFTGAGTFVGGSTFTGGRGDNSSSLDTRPRLHRRTEVTARILDLAHGCATVRSSDFILSQGLIAYLIV
jgi:hypothetical protein